MAPSDMKAIQIKDTIHAYPSIEAYWLQRSKPFTLRPATVNYHKLAAEEHYKDGWRDVVVPDFDPDTQHLGPLVYDKEKDIVTFEVVDKTAEELEQIRKSKIPYSITPTQGRVLLSQMPGSVEGESLLHDVLRLLPDSKTEPIQIYWEYALTWDLDSQFVTQMAAALRMSDEDVDNFFIQAAQILD